MTSIKGVIAILALLACTNAYSIHCEPCEQVECPVVDCQEGVQLIMDHCGCCEVCALGLGDACGGGSDLPCDESLVCAKPLALPDQPRRSPHEGFVLDYWSSWGTCQDPAEVHKCQLEGDSLCSYQGICLPDGDDHTCLCDLLWTGDDCSEKEVCPHNQELTSCGTSCPKVCGEPEPMLCTMQCVVGCQCPTGWWQNPDGSCVEQESQCDIVGKCPHNQEFSTCHSACPKICGEEEPMFCTYQCVVGCQCPTGWWQNPDGTCVEQESQCEIVGRCPYNQEYTNCGTACPKICGEPEPEFCTEQCIMDVCQCPWGWWQKSDGSCVQQQWECDLVIVNPGPIAGGYAKWQDVTDEVQNIADDVRDDVEEKYGRLKKYQAHSYKSQVVAGTNYNIRVDTGMKTYLEIVVYQHWSGTNELSSAEISEVRVVPVLSPDCQDNHDSCEGWASTGECCNNPGYMLSNCANSCGQCGDKPDLSCACKDKNKDCNAWAADGECCKNPDYMLENCPESCSQCGEINEVPGCTCMNYDPNCNGWAQGGECESNPGFMSKHCAQSCGQCSPVCTVECPDDCHCDGDMCICPDEPEPVLSCDDCPPECICGDYGDCLCQIIEPWVGGDEE